MGIKEDLAESNAQFISFFDVVRLVAECENCSDEISLNWLIDKGIFDNQIILSRAKNSTKITPFRDYFFNQDTGKIDFDPDSGTHFDPKIAAKSYLSWLKSSTSTSEDRTPPNQDLLETGLARKRFYDTLTVNNIYISPQEWQSAKSFLPDDESILSIEDYLNAHGARTIECLEKRNDCEKERIELKTKIDILTLENSKLKQDALERDNSVKDDSSIKKLTTKEEDSLVSILHILSHIQKIDLSNQSKTYTYLSGYALRNRLVIPSKNVVLKFLRMAGYPTDE